MKPRDFRAVNGLCLVDFDLLELPVSQPEALAILRKKGYQPVKHDIVWLAHSVLGTPFRRNVQPSAAPAAFDCSSLTQWLYGQIGFELPRLPIQQWETGVPIELPDVQPGDLIFADGRKRSRYSTDPCEKVGHVGLVAGDNAAVYTDWRRGVVEKTFHYFLKDGRFRGVRRITDLNRAVVLQLPSKRVVTTADDVKWVVLDNLFLRS